MPETAAEKAEAQAQSDSEAKAMAEARSLEDEEAAAKKKAGEEAAANEKKAADEKKTDFVWSSADDGISDVSWVGYVTGKTLQQAKDECEKPTRLDTNGKRCSGLFESHAGQYHFLYPGEYTFKKGGSTRAVYKLIDLGNVAAADKVNADAKGETYYFYCERFFSFQY